MERKTRNTRRKGRKKRDPPLLGTSWVQPGAAQCCPCGCSGGKPWERAWRMLSSVCRASPATAGSCPATTDACAIHQGYSLTWQTLFLMRKPSRDFPAFKVVLEDLGPQAMGTACKRVPSACHASAVRAPTTQGPEPTRLDSLNRWKVDKDRQMMQETHCQSEHLTPMIMSHARQTSQEVQQEHTHTHTHTVAGDCAHEAQPEFRA